MKRQYEALFLFDAGYSTEFPKAEAEIQRLMGRAEADLVFCKKWDERKLAYEIQGNKRGVYVLTYFMSEPDKLTGIERDVQISEEVLRVLIVKADHLTAEDIQGMVMPADRSAGPAADKGGARSETEAAAAPAEAESAVAVAEKKEEESKSPEDSPSDE